MSDQQYEPSTPVKQRNPIFPPGWYERYGLTPPSLKNFSAILGEAIQEDADADEQTLYTTESESTQHDAHKSSFEEWYNKLVSDAASELPMERSGSPELDISVADSELAPSTPARTGESIPELAEAGDVTPSRPISVLLETPWFDMTEHEKARVLLPMVHGQHPADVEAEGVAANNPAAASAGPSSTPSRGELHQEVVDNDEEDGEEELEARLVRDKARKTREDAKLKKEAKRAKHAAYMRRRRAEEKRLREEAEQKATKATKERMEMRKQAGMQQTRAELIAAEQVRVAQEQQQQMADQNSFGGLGFGSAFSSGA